MSIISAGTTTTTALVQTGNTDGTLQLQVNGTTPSVTLNTLGAIGVGATPGYGTTGQVLTSNGANSAPTWNTPTVTSPAGSTGQLQYNNAGSFGAISSGTTGQILTSAGAGAAPVWLTPSTASTGDVVFTSQTLSSPTWLLADGSVYLQASYSALFAKVGLAPTPSSALTWTTQTGLYPSSCGVYGNGIYVVGATNGYVNRSTDAASWTLQNVSIGGNRITGLAYGNGLFVAVAWTGKIATSSDGSSWTTQTSGTTNNLNGITFASGTFVAVGDGGTILTSTNGTTWTSRTSGTTNQLMGVTYGNSLFVAVGYPTLALSSPDGVTWTTRNSTGTLPLTSVAYGNKTFVAVGYNGLVTTSPDGLTWSSARPTGLGTTTLNSVAFGAGLFLVAGESSVLGVSYDRGNSWSARASNFGANMSILGAAFLNGLYFAMNNGSPQISTSPLGYDITTQFAVPYLANAAVTNTPAYVKT